MSDTETVKATRGMWTYLLETSLHTDMAGSERIMGLSVVAADYETKPFLALRLKLIAAVQQCYESESLEKLGGGDVKEAADEVDFTIAEATYLDLSVRVDAFEGALTLKRELWRAIATLYAKHRREKEALQ